MNRVGAGNVVVAQGTGFPFFDHLNLREVSTVERWRARYSDSDILACSHFSAETPPHLVNLRGSIYGSGISAERITGFLRRNPRKDAAA